MSSVRIGVMSAALLIVSAGSLGAQRIIQDATAAATGMSTGTAAGKQLGKGVSNIFGKVGQQMQQAAGTEMVRKTPVVLDPGAERAEEASPETSQPSLGAAPAQRRAARPTEVQFPRDPVFLAPAFSHRESAPALSRDDLAGLQSGTEREELLARVGRPNARVVIPEDGCLREVYVFLGTDGHLGSVELEDGAVSEVRLSRF